MYRPRWRTPWLPCLGEFVLVGLQQKELLRFLYATYTLYGTRPRPSQRTPPRFAAVFFLFLRLKKSELIKGSYSVAGLVPTLEPPLWRPRPTRPSSGFSRFSISRR